MHVLPIWSPTASGYTEYQQPPIDCTHPVKGSSQVHAWGEMLLSAIDQSRHARAPLRHNWPAVQQKLIDASDAWRESSSSLLQNVSDAEQITLLMAPPQFPKTHAYELSGAVSHQGRRSLGDQPSQVSAKAMHAACSNLTKLCARSRMSCLFSVTSGKTLRPVLEIFARYSGANWLCQRAKRS